MDRLLIQMNMMFASSSLENVILKLNSICKYLQKYLKNFVII